MVIARREKRHIQFVICDWRTPRVVIAIGIRIMYLDHSVSTRAHGVLHVGTSTPRPRLSPHQAFPNSIVQSCRQVAPVVPAPAPKEV